ncbi:MAG: sigma-54-dependent transcriptional regulator [Myxococcota bacterium]
MSDSPAALARLRVLVVDDEKNIRATLALCLEGVGCEVASVASGDAALAALARARFDVAFLDLRLADESGLDLIPKLLALCAELAIVVITAYATVETAVLAMRRGAYDYLQKPFTPAQIRHAVERVAERRALRTRIAELEARLADSAADFDLASDSPRMRALLDIAGRAARSDAAVLLRGESGTGKSVLAREIHRLSARAAGPFVVVSCPTLTEELLASELFGHARGAYTGAVQDQAGRVEAAEGGTLFLDEIGELSPGLQAKLLRFVQDREFERVGETRTRSADVRVIAATNRDLDADVRAGRFREDLLYRLNVVELTLPPLRERPEDILPLARGFLARFARAAKRAPLELSPATEEVLLRYAWPGNLRDLRNTMERIAILWPAQLVEPSALPERTDPFAQAQPRIGGDFTLEAIEREHIERVVARTRTQEEAARILGVDSSTLWRRRKRAESH